MIRTDLAMELASGQERSKLRGVTVEEDTPTEGITRTRVKIAPEGEALLHKPAGTYTTIECPSLFSRDPQSVRFCAQLLAEEIRAQIQTVPKNGTALVIGLGNWHITPDSLGPQTVSRTLVTRHIIEHMPDSIDERLRPVCALSPGVLGITGVETGEVVRGLVAHIHPDLVICIDSLAARETQRICTTLQLADTGIQPGSGIGNNRVALDQKTLGVPVLCIGVPMVVYASTIVKDAMHALLGAMAGEADPAGMVHNMLRSFKDEELDGLVKDVVASTIGDMVVTPKEVDDVVRALAATIALGLNLALHHGLEEEEIQAYMA